MSIRKLSLAAVVTALACGTTTGAHADARDFLADRVVLLTECGSIEACVVVDLDEVMLSSVPFSDQLTVPDYALPEITLADATFTGRLNADWETSHDVTFERDTTGCSLGFAAYLGRSRDNNPVVLTSQGPLELTDLRLTVGTQPVTATDCP